MDHSIQAHNLSLNIGIQAGIQTQKRFGHDQTTLLLSTKQVCGVPWNIPRMLCISCIINKPLWSKRQIKDVGSSAVDWGKAAGI